MAPPFSRPAPACPWRPVSLLSPLLGLAGAVLFGWFCVRLSGVYFAMLTLAFAQIAWSIAFQWNDVTGGDNGILGVWPSGWASGAAAFYYLALAVCVAGIAALRVLVLSPFGFALRATRDSTLRATAIGIKRGTVQWSAFIVAGTFAAVAGTLFAYLKGSVFPDNLGIPLSVDGLVMVLLGGIETLSGAVVGAVFYKSLLIWLISRTDYSKLALGLIIIVLVVAFPRGIGGVFEDIGQLRSRRAGAKAAKRAVGAAE